MYVVVFVVSVSLRISASYIPRCTKLATEPRIFYCPDFLSSAEADAIRELADPILAQTNTAGDHWRPDVRASDGRFINPIELGYTSSVVDVVRKRTVKEVKVGQ